ncbi:MAG: hypothetical protein CMN74_07470 [Sphingorhabdus sp.]|nr:hypothetical protein [Sphingorhabdus sp.]
MKRYFTEDHEWIAVEGDEATVGITDYAQEQLGDVVFVEVPESGAMLKKGNDAAAAAHIRRRVSYDCSAFHMVRPRLPAAPKLPQRDLKPQVIPSRRA